MYRKGLSNLNKDTKYNFYSVHLPITIGVIYLLRHRGAHTAHTIPLAQILLDLS